MGSVISNPVSAFTLSRVLLFYAYCITLKFQQIELKVVDSVQRVKTVGRAMYSTDYRSPSRWKIVVENESPKNFGA